MRFHTASTSCVTDLVASVELIMSIVMTQSRYLIRFDDICSTMNWLVWDAIESHLIRHQVRPILAVVPDNRDSNLIVAPPRSDFWQRVRRWQSKGYIIAMHGYQHQYVNNSGGLMRLTYQSEFASLPRKDQEAKLRSGLAIFSAHGVHVDAWVAPSHSFDKTTVALLAEMGVSVISDGLWRWPFTDANGVVWVPQQLWNFSPKPAGVWTVCCHHNKWTVREIEDFAQNLEMYASKITDMKSVIHSFAGRRATLVDHWTAFREWTWNHYMIPNRVRYRRAVNRMKFPFRTST
jgi:predicted deacetylase